MSVLVILLLAAGTLFLTTAALGILRMPDLLLRMHPTAKGASFGVGLVLIATIALHMAAGVAARALAAMAFVLLTAPVTAHLIARASYFAGGIRLWDGTVTDELAITQRGLGQAPEEPVPLGREEEVQEP